MSETLSLKEAIQSDRLTDFIEQEEARGVPACDLGELQAALGSIIKPQQSDDQTSSSRDDGCSTET
jgi:hypothetical protein